MKTDVDTRSVKRISELCRSLGQAIHLFFFFQAEDGIRDLIVTGVQTCALPISSSASRSSWFFRPSTVFFGPGAPLKPHDSLCGGSEFVPSAAEGDQQRMGRELHHLAALASDFSRSLLIFSTIPALRSATSLTLYSADVPSTCATSEGVNL